MILDLCFHTFTGATVKAKQGDSARWITVEEGAFKATAFLEPADVVRLITELQAMLPKAEGTVECAA